MWEELPKGVQCHEVLPHGQSHSSPEKAFIPVHFFMAKVSAQSSEAAEADLFFLEGNILSTLWSLLPFILHRGSGEQQVTTLDTSLGTPPWSVHQSLLD